MSSAALTAGWRFWGVDDREVHAQPETSSRSDASDALLEILALRERAGEPFERSVLQMLQDVNHRALLADLLGGKEGRGRVDGGDKSSRTGEQDGKDEMGSGQPEEPFDATGRGGGYCHRRAVLAG